MPDTNYITIDTFMFVIEENQEEAAQIDVSVTEK